MRKTDRKEKEMLARTLRVTYVSKGVARRMGIKDQITEEGYFNLWVRIGNKDEVVRVDSLFKKGLGRTLVMSLRKKIIATVPPQIELIEKTKPGGEIYYVLDEQCNSFKSWARKIPVIK